MTIQILMDSAGNAIEATEQSTLAIPMSFTDEDGEALTPDSIMWSLTNPVGDVINKRQDVAVAEPASSVTIVLSGDDLKILSGEETDMVWRIFIVEAVYDSVLGDNLPLKDSVFFKLRNLKKVT